MKCCGSQPRSNKLVVGGECQGKWSKNCQKGSELTERWTDRPTGENVHFFHLKISGIPREKTGKREKKEDKIALLLALISQKLSDKHQWQLHLCFGHQELGFKERVPDRHIFASHQGLVCLKVLHRLCNHPPLSLSNVSWTREGWTLRAVVSVLHPKPELRSYGSPTQAASLGNQQSYNRLLQKLCQKKISVSRWFQA